jgi:hypothetical protein
MYVLHPEQSIFLLYNVVLIFYSANSKQKTVEGTLGIWPQVWEDEHPLESLNEVLLSERFNPPSRARRQPTLKPQNKFSFLMSSPFQVWTAALQPGILSNRTIPFGAYGETAKSEYDE